MVSPIKVAFLGPEGTYTHQFGNDPQHVEIFPQPSIKACFDQIHSKNVDYAVIPSENSTNGQVVFTYDLLRDWFIPAPGTPAPRFGIVAEQFVAIHHYLFSKAHDLSHVEKLYSHPQVWGQVADFLGEEKFNGKYSRIDTNSTAQAAEKVFEDPTNTSACISSKMSGQLYNLPTKAAEIEDLKGNTTRFLVLGYGPMLSSESDSHKDVSLEEKDVGAHGKPSCVTSLVFVLNDNDPGALCEALNAFKSNAVNLTAITSRPSKVTSWEYVFFVEAEGPGDSLPMRRSVEMLHEHCSKVAVLGSYLRSWRYKKQ
ncbi:hypothetical protein JCM33374_g6441 [Metschnikowia sp. JCM 33374]|nr:hypothetical protein JCM33374_g6441 [Metschnikowia sp. JCM 33374]